jgi:hypothetical protein
MEALTTTAPTMLVPVELANGTTIYVRSTVTVADADDFRGEDMPSLRKVGEAIEGVAQDLFGSIQKVKPDKASVELGFEISGTAGIPILAQGTATANVTVTLEWEEEPPPA